MLKNRILLLFSLSIVWLVVQNIKVVNIPFNSNLLSSPPTVILSPTRTAAALQNTSVGNVHDKNPWIYENRLQNSTHILQKDIVESGPGKWNLQSQEQRTKVRKAQFHNNNNVTILTSWDTKEITSTNYVRFLNETILGENHLVRINASNHGRIQSADSVNQKLRKKFHATLNFSMLMRLDRIYYINMDHRRLRRAIMESWLSKQSIPYTRVSGKPGQENVCRPNKNGKRCVGISGLAQTNVRIMETLDTKGTTLVVEDDFVIRDMKKLLASVHLVPPDWDVLRWDCWDLPLPHFPKHPFSYKVGPINKEVCQNRKDCWHCGGTHVVMWKGGESLEKLRRVWGTPPHDGIDCQLTHPSLNTYCIQIGVGEFHLPMTELSDIIKGRTHTPERNSSSG